MGQGQQRPPEPILHVDMDAFYAAVEVRRDPQLAGQPVLVGGGGDRGVVASASYEARPYGIHSAMPLARARRLCPHAVVIPPDFAAYQAVSERLMALLRSVTPKVEPLSLDEAFCDVGGSVRLFGAPETIAASLRQRIAGELGLVASVGVAPNKFLAKLCSAEAKPDGVCHLPVGEVGAFLGPLSVQRLWGVGGKTAASLERYGIHTVGDLATTPVSTLVRMLGQAGADHLRQLAHGHDPQPVVPWEPAKSLSAEETFETDVDDPAVLRRELLGLAERVARRLRDDHLATRTVTLKLRYANFATVTRSQTLATATDQATVLHREATGLLDGLRLERVRVRLLGLGATNLGAGEAAGQLQLLPDSAGEGPDEERWGELEHAADAVRARFGDAAITRGALLDDEQ
jgi:DNA polymerase-4